MALTEERLWEFSKLYELARKLTNMRKKKARMLEHHRSTLIKLDRPGKKNSLKQSDTRLAMVELEGRIAELDAILIHAENLNNNNLKTFVEKGSAYLERLYAEEDDG